MEQIPLLAQKRTVIGRKVKTLRREGIIPAHVFGHKIKTVHIQVKENDFSKVFGKTGETGIIDLSVDNQKRPVLVKNVQKHPVSDLPLHIDFHQVNLAEKVKVDVPLEIIGEARAVHKKIGLLLTPVKELEIEALPGDIPDKIEIDITNLENVGDEVKVSDLKVDRSKVEIHADDELVVVQIGELVTREMEEVEAEIEAEQAEVAEEKVEEEAEAEAKEEAGAVEKPEDQDRKEETKAEEKPQEEKKE